MEQTRKTKTVKTGLEGPICDYCTEMTTGAAVFGCTMGFFTGQIPAENRTQDLETANQIDDSVQRTGEAATDRRRRKLERQRCSDDSHEIDRPHTTLHQAMI